MVRLLFGILLWSTQAAITFTQETELVAPSPTNWGTWGNFDTCPNGTFVRGMQLKVELDQGTFVDDTALNGLRLYCDKFEPNHNITMFSALPISSSYQQWGSWGSIFNCGEFQVATGFQMRFEPSQGWYADDTAANNVRLMCNAGKKVLEGGGTTWGSWYAACNCPERKAMCGLSTQVYFSSGVDDHTAMDGLKVKCCDIPNPAKVCVPTDSWDLLIECDNVEAVSPTKCIYEKKVGTSNYTSTSEHHWDWMNTYTNIGFDLSGAAGPLLLNFKTNLNISTSTGYDWNTSSQETWFEEITTTVSFNVPPKVKTQLFQVYGTCGIYGARSSRFKRVDRCDKGNGLFQEIVTYFDA